jgi:hypothetical protein
VAGLQLYSLRAQMAKDPQGTLAEVHAWGIKYVELAGTYGMTPEQFKAKLAKCTAWTPSAAIFRLRNGARTRKPCCARRGTWVWSRSAAPGFRMKARSMKRRAAMPSRFSTARAQLASQHHMHFFYHTHGYEFQPYGDGTLFDLLMRETVPANVKFEMDIFWIVHAGQDPVKLLKKYPGRWELMHLKDMRKGTPTGLLTGSSDVNNDVALGTGMIDLPAILLEARKVGVQWYFIEDESTNSEEQIPQSLVYLRDLKR